MPSREQYIKFIFITWVVLVSLPTLLYTGLYPIQRPGMFSDRASAKSYERFVLITPNKDTATSAYIGMDDYEFQYLARSYWHEGRVSKLLQKMDALKSARGHTIIRDTTP